MNHEEIEHQRELLRIYRNNARHFIRQAKSYDSIVRAPAHTIYSIVQTQKNIARIKAILRNAYVTCEDFPEDTELSDQIG